MAVTVAGVAFMMYPILMQDADTKVKEGSAVVVPRLAGSPRVRVFVVGARSVCSRCWL